MSGCRDQSQDNEQGISQYVVEENEHDGVRRANTAAAASPQPYEKLLSASQWHACTRHVPPRSISTS